MTQEDSSELTDDLLRRQRGWTYRGDAVQSRSRSVEGRRPQRSRYVKIQESLRNDLFNGRWELVGTSRISSRNEKFATVDLFSGCGGLSLGFKMAGFHSHLAVEVDPDASATYRRNFPDAFVWDDLVEKLPDRTALEAIDGQEVNVLLAGFPCQGFSVAGKRDPDDPRNKLFWQTIRFAALMRPWFVVLENVPGIITMQNGRVLEMIREEFSKIGYPGMSALVLEAADYGVPQYRPRTIFIANRFGETNPYPAKLKKPDEYVTIEEAIDDLAAEPRNPKLNHDWTHHSPSMEKRIAAVEPGGSLYDSYTDAWKRQYMGSPSMTVKENHGGTHIHYRLNRTLSAREMARLQSFPDDFIFEGRMKRAMFQVGNAVPPLLAKAIALALKPTLRRMHRQMADEAR